MTVLLMSGFDKNVAVVITPKPTISARKKIIHFLFIVMYPFDIVKIFRRG